MASVCGVGEESFLSHVERVRSEVKSKFIRAHEILQAREADLLAELQRLLDGYRGKGITQQMKELSESKDALIKTIKGNENKEFLENQLSNIDTLIAELETKLQKAKVSYKSVSLEWDVELEKKLSVAGEIRLNAVKEGIQDYKEIGDPVAVFGKHSTEGSSPGVFYCPNDIAINPVNKFITNHMNLFFNFMIRCMYQLVFVSNRTRFMSHNIALILSMYILQKGNI